MSHCIACELKCCPMAAEHEKESDDAQLRSLAARASFTSNHLALDVVRVAERRGVEIVRLLALVGRLSASA